MKKILTIMVALCGAAQAADNSRGGAHERKTEGVELVKDRVMTAIIAPESRRVLGALSTNLGYFIRGIFRPYEQLTPELKLIVDAHRSWVWCELPFSPL